MFMIKSKIEKRVDIQQRLAQINTTIYSSYPGMSSIAGR